ncbi:MAG: DUF883 C-terminal domain-containing protein [Akkermansia sp.]
MENNNTPSLDHAKNDLKTAATLASNAVIEATDVVKEQATQARQVAAGRFNQAREFAAAKVGQLRQTAGEQASHLRQYATEKALIIRQKAEIGWDVTSDKAKQLHKSGEEYVKENPTKSVLIALGVGFLLGSLIRRR